MNSLLCLNVKELFKGRYEEFITHLGTLDFRLSISAGMSTYCAFEMLFVIISEINYKIMLLHNNWGKGCCLYYKLFANISFNIEPKSRYLFTYAVFLYSCYTF